MLVLRCSGVDVCLLAFIFYSVLIIECASNAYICSGSKKQRLSCKSLELSLVESCRWLCWVVHCCGTKAAVLPYWIRSSLMLCLPISFFEEMVVQCCW